MKKLILVIICASFMILATGCQSVFNTIPKDTVMVKKIIRENENIEAEYEGVLSQDAVKTLSLNAVNKYFDENLTTDEFQFELVVIDQNKFKVLLSEAENTPRVKSAKAPELKVNDQTEFSPYSGGLYYTTMTKLTDPDEVYDIVLNARDGDVIKAVRGGETIQNFARNTVEDDRLVKYHMNEVIPLATKFIQDKGSYLLSDLSLNEGMTRSGGVVELYYMSKDGDKLKYTVTVDLKRNEVVGFSKDVMALLSYFSRL
ncbi:hypothetical protein E0485_10205 [Paenibacillus albiflavus]|uniref:Uncharacterized protein n=1 Tax=Paenibacillus albiflavus TaxID=2545760 RepID=A0A4R4EEF2_9BACL|nr:hypothetical protein [Paenibacillus albiflavus]TCZ77837.1 hypothetical protein E0485_10205 [Paenibacillus albiflavus]